MRAGRLTFQTTALRPALRNIEFVPAEPQLQAPVRQAWALQESESELRLASANSARLAWVLREQAPALAVLAWLAQQALVWVAAPF